MRIPMMPGPECGQCAYLDTERGECSRGGAPMEPSDPACTSFVDDGSEPDEDDGGSYRAAWNAAGPNPARERAERDELAREEIWHEIQMGYHG